MAPPAGLEPAAPGLGNRCSILLSYGGVSGMLNGQHFLSFFMEGVKKTDLAGVFKPVMPIGVSKGSELFEKTTPTPLKSTAVRGIERYLAV